MGNRNRNILFATLLMSAPFADGQVVSWVRQFGTADSDGARAVAVDGSGVYVAGSTGVASGPQVPGAFVRKYDAAGKSVWTREFGSADSESADALAIDTTGIYVAGAAHRLPGQTTLGFGDAFVRKYDLDGNEQWTRQFGTTSADYATGVASDGHGIYVIGDTLDSLPGQRSAGEYDAFVRKYDLAGNELWTRQFGSFDNEYTRAAAADSTGVYVVGQIWGGSLPGQTRTGGTDVFVRKYDVNGNELWTRQFGTAGYDEVSAAAADATGIYVIGGVPARLPGQTSDGAVFLRKYDASGRELWTRQFGEYGRDELTAIAAGAAGIYVAGDSMLAVPGQEGSWVRGPVLRKYDPSGNQAWSLPLGTYRNSEHVLGLATDGTGVYVVGSTSGVLGESSAGGSDGFLLKIGLLRPFASVSAANYIKDSALAAESIAGGFGEGLAKTAEGASSMPLPTTLVGTSVKVRDAADAERLAPLFFVSPTQINYLVPAGTAAGPVTITVISENQEVAAGSLRIEAVAPGLFSANTQGTGVAAAVCVRVAADGRRTEALVFDPGTQRPVPVDLGPGSDQMFLSLFGTGIRGFRSAVAATVGGLNVSVIGAAAQPQFAGLDQVNIGPLPRALAGRGEAEIVVSVDGKRANTVTVSVK